MARVTAGSCGPNTANARQPLSVVTRHGQCNTA